MTSNHWQRQFLLINALMNLSSEEVDCIVVSDAAGPAGMKQDNVSDNSSI